MSDLITNSKRNSLIELYRFLFSFNVLIGHGFFPENIRYFGPSRVSVEFFFILSGYFFFASLQKIKDFTIIQAVKTILVSKMKPIMIPTMIGIVANIVYNFATNATLTDMLKIWKYLWYIPAMMAIFVLYTVFYILIKKQSTFLIVVASIGVLAAILRFSGNDVLFWFDYVRSAATISLGILLKQIPKIKIKFKVFWWILLIPILALVYWIVKHYIVEIIWFNWFRGIEAILDLIIYPIIIYITFQIDFNSRIFNYLGALSFGIYAYQCVGRMLLGFGVDNRYLVFWIIIALAVIEDALKRICKHINKKYEKGSKIRI